MQKKYELSREIANSLVLNQYENNANFEIHKQQTGAEIYDQTNGTIDIFIAGAGTGACVKGGNTFSPHALQGIGPNFIPGNFKRKYIDHIFHVSKEQSYQTAQLLAEKAGIACGISGGSTGYAALEVAKSHNQKVICFLVADFCERYSSGDFFIQ